MILTYELYAVRQKPSSELVHCHGIPAPANLSTLKNIYRHKHTYMPTHISIPVTVVPVAMPHQRPITPHLSLKQSSAPVTTPQPQKPPTRCAFACTLVCKRACVLKHTCRGTQGIGLQEELLAKNRAHTHPTHQSLS